jgi:hypothetical protein
LLANNPQNSDLFHTTFFPYVLESNKNCLRWDHIEYKTTRALGGGDNNLVICTPEYQSYPLSNQNFKIFMGTSRVWENYLPKTDDELSETINNIATQKELQNFNKLHSKKHQSQAIMLVDTTKKEKYWIVGKYLIKHRTLNRTLIGCLIALSIAGSIIWYERASIIEWLR